MSLKVPPDFSGGGKAQPTESIKELKGIETTGGELKNRN
jgi:hypothetical protein